MLKEILENLKQENEYACYKVNNEEYTNKDLYKFVTNIYYYLLEYNKEKTNVLVYGHKDIYMIASFLACSLAGITYIPLDNSVPIERKNKIINEAKVDLIIDKSIENIMYENTNKQIDNIYLKEEDIYYIIYTSGSTGEPKGVKVTYKNLKSCMKWVKEICNCKEKSVILNQAIFSFDLSVADIYLSLLTKSKHVVLEKEVQKEYIKLFEEIRKNQVELAIITPSFIDYLLLDKDFNSDNFNTLKKVLFCGEKLNIKTIQKLYDRFPNLEIINSYGPTECTFAVTSIHLNKSFEEISIGTPKSDVSIFIVDENLQEVKDGEIGEILISGESVSNGYVNEELNINKFIDYKNNKAYLTGDLGYIKNNEIYCIGRKDKQIKYKGYRIELLEIEKVLDTFGYVEKSIVVPLIKNEKVNRIIAFIKLKENEEVSQEIILEKLKHILPEYMIPIIKIIKNIPLNLNGKIDENKLLEEF